MALKEFFLLCLTILPQFVYPYETITLEKNNTVVLRGEITQDSADKFLMDLISHDNNTSLYIYIHSPGGSVIAGQRIVQYMQTQNITCITDKAYSMAFVILQTCRNRYITPTASVMQHQQSLGFEGNLYAMNNYLQMINQIDKDMNTLQAKRLNISLKEFHEKTSLDWWLYGEDIIKNKVADNIVHVSCSKELIKTNVSVTTRSFFGKIKDVFSACPLIVNPIGTNEQTIKFSFMETD